LPPDFDRWEITDKYDRIVAQIAYKHNHLPPNFDRWDLIEKRQED
jgi:endonuclease YncB( thermonuclease family)